jgi:hypothetical protein
MKNEKKEKKRKKHTFGWQKFLLLLAIYKHLLHLLLGWARMFLNGGKKKREKRMKKGRKKHTFGLPMNFCSCYHNFCSYKCLLLLPQPLVRLGDIQ